MNVEELRERAFAGSGIQPQGNETALLVQRIAKPECVRLQLRPVGAESICRHAEHKHAGVLVPLLDLCRDAVTRADLRSIHPHSQPVCRQPLCDCAHHELVFGAVAEEDVEENRSLLCDK